MTVYDAFHLLALLANLRPRLSQTILEQPPLLFEIRQRRGHPGLTDIHPGSDLSQLALEVGCRLGNVLALVSVVVLRVTQNADDRSTIGAEDLKTLVRVFATSRHRSRDTSATHENVVEIDDDVTLAVSPVATGAVDAEIPTTVKAVQRRNGPSLRFEPRSVRSSPRVQVIVGAKITNGLSTSAGTSRRKTLVYDILDEVVASDVRRWICLFTGGTGESCVGCSGSKAFQTKGVKTGQTRGFSHQFTTYGTFRYDVQSLRNIRLCFRRHLLFRHLVKYKPTIPVNTTQ